MSRRFSSNAISILRFSYNQHLVQIYGVDKKEKKHLFRTVVRLEKRFRKKKENLSIAEIELMRKKKKKKNLDAFESAIKSPISNTKQQKLIRSVTIRQ